MTADGVLLAPARLAARDRGSAGDGGEAGRSLEE